MPSLQYTHGVRGCAPAYGWQEHAWWRLRIGAGINVMPPLDPGVLPIRLCPP